MTSSKSILLVKYLFLKVKLIFKFWWNGACNDLLTHFIAFIALFDTYKAENNASQCMVVIIVVSHFKDLLPLMIIQSLLLIVGEISLLP